MHEEAQRLLADYDEGNITWNGLILHLILMSTDVDPSEYYEELPDDVKAGVRECTEDLAASPSEHVTIGSNTMFGTFEEVRSQLDTATKHSFDAHWRMHRYIFREGVELQALGKAARG
jgi:hypothetical protein